MDNFEEEEKMLLEQLNNVRRKIQLKKIESNLNHITETIDSKKIILTQLQDEINQLENNRFQLFKLIDLYKTELIEPVIKQIIEPVVEQIIEPVVEPDSLTSFELSKTLSKTELDNLSFWKRSIEVNMNELKVGDYIISYGKYSSQTTYGKITRITNKTIFFKLIENSKCVISGNKILHYDWLVKRGNRDDSPYTVERSYDYYYHNINDDKHLSTTETKQLIKNEKIRKAVGNFIDIIELDWGR